MLLIPQAEGGFVVSVPDLPSVATEGDTLKEALDMAKDAITGYLATMREEGWRLPAVQHKGVTVDA